MLSHDVNSNTDFFSQWYLSCCSICMVYVLVCWKVSSKKTAGENHLEDVLFENNLFCIISNSQASQEIILFYPVFFLKTLQNACVYPFVLTFI